MALSHQWFIQWSSPSSVFADINNRYQSVNTWSDSKPEPDWAWEVTLQKNGDIYNYQDYKQDNNYYSFPKAENSQSNDRSRAPALALWLTMLGMARSQIVPADINTPPFNTLYKWKTIDFEFPSPVHRRHALASGKYIPENVLPLGVEVYGSRVWVTFPSWRKGVPATLATVSRQGGLASPPLKPYPDWSYHRAYNDGNNCTGLTSVFRISIDPCGRLWVLDSGQIDSQDNPKQMCPPSIVLFDLKTDKFIRRFIIPSKYVLQDSLYANIVVDTKTPDCSDLHLYIADTWRFGLLVFREIDETFWRFSHHTFYPDPLASNFTLHETNFQWADGIFGLALNPIKANEERVLFFHSLASYREFYVPTWVLQNSEMVNKSAMHFNLVGDSRGLSGQASASAIDRRGVMFYGLVSQDSIGCWNTKLPLINKNLGIIAKDSETLIFPNDIKIDQEGEQSVWVISNKLPMFQAGSLDSNDYNYRILFADTNEAVKGSICNPDIDIRVTDRN